jgi:hypothetical protein
MEIGERRVRKLHRHLLDSLSYYFGFSLVGLSMRRANAKTFKTAIAARSGRWLQPNLTIRRVK